MREANATNLHNEADVIRRQPVPKHTFHEQMKNFEVYEDLEGLREVCS